MDIILIILFILVAVFFTYIAARTSEPIFLMFAGILILPIALDVITNGYQTRGEIQSITSANYTYFSDSNSREIANMTMTRQPLYLREQTTFTSILGWVLVILGTGLMLKSVDFLMAGRRIGEID